MKSFSVPLLWVSLCLTYWGTSTPSVWAVDPAELPKCPPGWKVELVAAVPKIQHPSVVCCAPDGRVFVGEDPMDMGSDSRTPTDRILCFHPDGKVTVFADNLYAVFGMAYIDGKLFVHHCPKFSVFTDDHGVGKDRQDLIECTNPNPAPGFNDHIPSNMRLAMDGYLYVSTGDKGVFGAVGKDGRKCEIYGGGVFRIRPDGTGLETYCTGTRNHLDVAINREDEIFTYDNTDDGNGWWTRVTHMVDGGFYGYPWDYKPRRPYTLWMMTDYGGGAPTGATAYNEDALPEVYQGNLFLCEWGRKQLLRLIVQREGGSYKIVKREDFLTSGTKEFRPVGICTTPDGMGFYVTDWNFSGWKQNVPAGRLLKVTYTGASKATEKPKWFVPAAIGEKFEASNEDLIAGLKHPSQEVRLVAQRRLIERGPEVSKPLLTLLSDNSSPAYARWSAIWALDAISGDSPATRKDIAVYLGDSDPSVRRQVLRELGSRSANEATSKIISCLEDADASVRFQAATALGRIGNSAAITPLLQYLKTEDLFSRYAAFTALNRIGHTDPKYWDKIVVGLSDPNPRIQEGTTFAIRETFENGLVYALKELIAEPGTNPSVRVQALHSLAELHRKPAPWKGQWWGTQPVRSPKPHGTLDWVGTKTVLNTLAASLKDGDPQVVHAAIEGVIVAQDEQFVPGLVELFQKDSSTETRKLVLRAAAVISKPAPFTDLVTKVLEDPVANKSLLDEAIRVGDRIGSPGIQTALVKLVSQDLPPETLSKLLRAVGNRGLKDAIPAVANRVSNDNANVRESAVFALTKMGDAASLHALTPLLSSPNLETRKVAVNAIGSLKSPAATEGLLGAFDRAETRYEALLGLSKLTDSRALPAYLVGLASKNATLRADCRKALSDVRNLVYPEIEKRLDAGAISPEVVGELQSIYAAKSPIKWKLLGPFAVDSEIPFDLQKPDLRKEYSGREARKFRWKSIPTQDRDPANLDWRREVRIDGPSKAFGQSEVYSPVAGEITLEGSFSGAELRLWLNGEQIFKSEKAGRISLNAKTQAGENMLIAEALTTGGSWTLRLAANTPKSGKLFAASAAKPIDIKKFSEHALKKSGSAERGKLLFSDIQGLGCIKCHKVGNLGTGEVGPDLLGVGAKYNREILIESVLYPSKQILDGYQQTRIATSSGQVKLGIVRGETGDAITLIDVDGKKESIKKVDIEERKVLDKSLMPDGLQAGLSLQDFSDLIAFLESLKEKPPEKK
ncbi:HEAT repeat domain-containing protein [Telmatocola sphagniphila]|uniref:HEAT repeat domain-containing protein n=1 Tax=Telmatocola sphagniphila TaxID=1123043 RepID=A0A8E6B1G4_9BACT|nr:HEAT repeat domain-containing protein [Telmatocola sphagniphila]QVL29836.1 HEAT repeat domain-containing protein [Telmatocola sphagniphila]